MEPPDQPPVLTPPRRSGLALASMILGIVGVLPCPGPLAGLTAVICGHKAHRQIGDSSGGIRGSGMASAGLVLGYFSIVLFAVILTIGAMQFSLRAKAGKPGRETACMANLKAIEGAKGYWALEMKKQHSDVPTDADIFGPDKAIREKPECPAGGIYTLNAVSNSPSCSVHGGLSQLGVGQ